MKNFNIMGVHGSLKNPILGEGFTENQYVWGDCLKRGYGQFGDLRGGLVKKTGGEGSVFKER